MHQRSAVLAVAATAAMARRNEVSRPEERVFRLVNRLPDGIHPPVWLIMQWGSLGGVYATAAAVWHSANRRHAVVIASVGSIVWLGVKAVKPCIGRGRPEHHLDDVNVRGAPQSGLGYPSGHAASATTLALLVADGPSTRRLALFAATLTGTSRMYAGAHLPLDVVGGFAIGAAVAGATRRTIEALTTAATPGPAS